MRHEKEDWADAPKDRRTDEGRLRDKIAHRRANLSPEQLINRRAKNLEAVRRYQSKMKEM